MVLGHFCATFLAHPPPHSFFPSVIFYILIAAFKRLNDVTGYAAMQQM